MGAGYSKRSLIDKLGIKPGYHIRLVNAPHGYSELLGPLPAGVVEVSHSQGELDLLQYFAHNQHAFRQEFDSLARQIKPSGALWISWPKRASNSPTDLNESIIRDIGLAGGLVDVKVIAVDPVWSGLKFVYRLKDRP